MIPKNEKEVVYLFSKYHQELGFEKILSFQQFPDCTALKDGKKVTIEFEFWASYVSHHYGYVRSGGLKDDWVEGRWDFESSPIDFVICWIKDKELDIPVQVIELRSRLGVGCLDA